MPVSTTPPPAEAARRLLDRADLAELAGRYLRALDAQDWAALRGTLAATLHTDFSRYTGQPAADVAADDWVAGLRRFLGTTIRTEHLSANHEIVIDGDEAEVRCSLATRHHEARGEGRGGGPDQVRDNTVHAQAWFAAAREGGRWAISGLRVDLLWLDGDPTIGQG